MAGVQYPIDPVVAASDPNLAQAGLDYQTQMKQLEWKQDLAKSLLADSEKPLSSGIGARGMAYRVSPWEGLARMVQGGAGAYMGTQNIEDAKMLANKYGKTIIGAMNPSAAQQPQGNPVVPNGGFKPSDPAQTAVNPNASAMMAHAVDQLRKEGVPEANLRSAAAHLVGQANAESGLNPNAMHDGNTGFGIYGARLERADGMKTWLKDNGYAANSAEGQMRYMAHEAMSGKFGPTRDVLMNASPERLDKDSWTVTGNFENPKFINPRHQDVRNAYNSYTPQPAQQGLPDQATVVKSERYGPDGQLIKDIDGRLQPPAQPGGPVQQVPNPFQQQQPPQGAPVAPQPMPAAGPVAQQPPQQGTAPGTFGKPAWSIEGVSDPMARAYAMAHPEQWASMKAASLRAYSPTDIQKSIQHLPPNVQQMILTAHANQAAGLVDPKTGIQTTYGSNGPSQSAMPGSMEVRAGMKSAEAAAEKSGQESGGYPGELNKRAENAAGVLRSTAELKNLNTNPGLFAGVKEDVGKFFRSMGASDETIQKYLKVSPGNLEASQKLTAQMAIETVKQISQRPTQMEFQKFLEANPNIFQTPEGFKRVTQFLENAANDTIHEQGAFLQARRSGLQPHEFNTFAADYNQKRAAAASAGQFNSAAPTGGAPAAPPPPPSGAPAAPQTKVINGQTYTNVNGQWFHGGAQ